MAEGTPPEPPHSGSGQLPKGKAGTHMVSQQSELDSSLAPSDSPPSLKDSQHLQSRIDSLELELAELKATGHKQQQLIDNERWLTSVIKHLFSYSTDGAVQHSLAQLGAHLQLDGVCFYQVSAVDSQISVHTSWQENLSKDTWSILAEQLPAQLLEPLLKGQNQVFETPIQLDFLLSTWADHCVESDIYALACLPVTRRGCINGFLCLINASFVETPRSNLSRRFNNRDLRLAETLAEVIDMVIEQGQMTRRLAERDTRFQYAMEASRDGLWDWDISTDHIYFSYSFLRMLGFHESPPSMNYETLIERFIHPEDRAMVVDKLQSAIIARVDHLNIEYRMIHSGGHHLWIYSRIRFVERDSSGCPTRAVGINADISHFKESQQELLTAKLQADSANKTKSEFLNRMSHEIRTPLNAIIGMGHLLRDTAMNRNQLGYLDHIDQAAAHLLHTIDKVLDFSKLDSDRIVLDQVHFDLDEVLNNLLQVCERDAQLKNLAIVVDCASQVPRYLKGDAVRLNQILYHLVNNAIKFSDQGSILIEITLDRIESSGPVVNFSIKDQGIGMSQERVDSLFVPFSQADTSSRRRFSGTGLGLTLCKHLIELMHGHIHIDSIEGEGCNVHFDAQFKHSQIGDLPIRCDSNQYEHLRTLIVDDNAIARTVLDKTASGLKLDVDTASSAEEAIAKIEAVDKDPNKRYELVLMDWQMPGVDGIKACKMLRQDPQVRNPPPVILVSAYRKDEVLQGGDVPEIASFINKPVSQSRLFDAISEIYEPSPDSGEALEDIDAVLKGARVLLAEDNVVNQKVAVALLKKKGINVILANNGREAIEVMAQRDSDFDAVLMDIEMPDVDGFEATRALRQGRHQPDIPIIALTAQALKGDRERCLNSGMDAYLSKPFEPKSLYSVLAQMIHQSGRIH